MDMTKWVEYIVSELVPAAPNSRLFDIWLRYDDLPPGFRAFRRGHIFLVSMPPNSLRAGQAWLGKIKHAQVKS